MEYRRRTVAADRCPRCGGDNEAAWGHCAACSQALAPELWDCARCGGQHFYYCPQEKLERFKPLYVATQAGPMCPACGRLLEQPGWTHGVGTKWGDACISTEQAS